MSYSKWYYGHLVTADNNKIDFNEGAGELTATLRNGSYTLEEYAEEISTQMTVVGGQVYSAIVSRETRKVTISAPGTFALLVATGTHLGTSGYLLGGFTGANRTAASSYIGNEGSGYEFKPQFPLQSLSDFSESREYIDSSVNIAASGYVEVVSFGSIRRLDCDVKFQTNTFQNNQVIRNDPSGFQNLKDFMEYSVQKGKMEFMVNEADPSSYVNCILDKTDAGADGTAYKIKRMIGQNLWEYYETGTLNFREVF